MVNLPSSATDPRLANLEGVLKEFVEPRTKDCLKESPDMKHPAHRGPVPNGLEDGVLLETEVL